MYFYVPNKRLGNIHFKCNDKTLSGSKDNFLFHFQIGRYETLSRFNLTGFISKSNRKSKVMIWYFSKIKSCVGIQFKPFLNNLKNYSDSTNLQNICLSKNPIIRKNSFIINPKFTLTLFFSFCTIYQQEWCNAAPASSRAVEHKSPTPSF